MKKMLVIMIVFMLFAPKADACVGRKLNIGIINSIEGQIFGEMLSAMISERTGTTVYIKPFKNQQELYDAVRIKQVDIMIENTTKALHGLNKPVDANPQKAYETVKTIYEKEKGLAWLRPFGFLKADGVENQSYSAAVLRVEVFSDFPALPRVIGKLGGAINDETYMKLIRSAESGEKPRKVARDFLKSKKLI